MTAQIISPVYPEGIHPKVAAINFERLSWKLSQSSEAKMSTEDCTLAEREYRRFLTLKVMYPKMELVPNKLLDEYWHAHILDTAAYRKDCDAVFGYFLDHFPYFGIYGQDDRNNLEQAFHRTVALYEQHFGPYPLKQLHASRCEGHACHAPTECACRVEGACK